MNDEDVIHRISQIVDEEHRLQQHAVGNPLADEERRRLEQLEVSLDQCWDLLRQRQARRHAGLDPDEATPRDPAVVERYLQ